MLFDHVLAISTLDSQSAYLETSSILALKTKEIENLRVKLKEMEDLSKSRIVDDVSDPQPAPGMAVLEDRLNQIQVCI